MFDDLFYLFRSSDFDYSIKEESPALYDNPTTPGHTETPSPISPGGCQGHFTLRNPVSNYGDYNASLSSPATQEALLEVKYRIDIFQIVDEKFSCVVWHFTWSFSDN